MLWLVVGLPICISVVLTTVMYGKKLPSLILKKTNRLTQAVGFFRRHFLCGVLLCNCSSAERGGLFRHNTCTTGIFTRTLYAQHPVSLRIFPSLPGSHLRFFIAMQIQYSYDRTFVQHAVNSMSRILCVRNCSRRSVRRECPAESLMRNIVCRGYFHLSKVLAYDFLSPDKFCTLQCTVFDTLQPK